MIVITVPVLFPALAAYHIDPIWFGVILVMFVELGQISPPIGINLFVIQSVWDGRLADVVLGTIPFHVIMFLLLVCWCSFPGSHSGCPPMRAISEAGARLGMARVAMVFPVNFPRLAGRSPIPQAATAIPVSLAGVRQRAACWAGFSEPRQARGWSRGRARRAGELRKM